MYRTTLRRFLTLLALWLMASLSLAAGQPYPPVNSPGLDCAQKIRDCTAKWSGSKGSCSLGSFDKPWNRWAINVSYEGGGGGVDQYCSNQRCKGEDAYDSASGMCIPSGQDPDKECEKNKGKIQSRGWYDIGGKAGNYPPAVSCSNGCSVTYSGGSATKTGLINGQRRYFAEGIMVFDGAKCTDGAPTAPASTTNPGQGDNGEQPPVCKPGEQSGTVNGRPVCLKGSPPAVTPGTDPNKSTDKDGNAGNGDSNNPDPDSINGYCQRNPNSPMCQKGGDVTPGAGGGSSSGGGNSGGDKGEMNCPDCAKETTLQGVKSDTNTLKENSNKIKELLDPASTNPADAYKDGEKTIGDAFKPIEDGIKKAQQNPTAFGGLKWDFDPLLPTGGACQPLKADIPLLKASTTLDYCWAIDMVRGALGWLAYVFTAMAIFAVATAKREGK